MMMVLFFLFLLLVGPVIVFGVASGARHYSFTGGAALGMATFMAGSTVWSIALAVAGAYAETSRPILVGLVSLAGSILVFSAVLGRLAPWLRRLLYAGVLLGVTAAAFPFVWSFGPFIALAGWALFLFMAFFDPRLRLLQDEDRAQGEATAP